MQPVELARLKASGCGRRVDYDLDNRFGQAIHRVHPCNQLGIELIDESFPLEVTARLLSRIQSIQFFAE